MKENFPKQNTQHPLTSKEMYEAVLQNNESYDSVFFYAVKSTGIYCRPSCKSKAPKVENTEFFKSAEDALLAGYRPCKRCRSDLLDYKPMKDIAVKLKNLIDSMYYEINELHSEMEKIPLSNKRMVELFKEEYGITPSSYVNDLRLKEAKRLLEESNVEIIDIAFAVGFGSLSTFYRFFTERTNMSPAAYRKGKNK